MSLRMLLSWAGRGAGWKLGADLLGRLMQYFLLWLAARQLDVAGFGDFTFALSVGYMLSQVADFGLQLYVQRELARLSLPPTSPNSPPQFTDRAAAEAVVGGGLLVKAGLSALSMALLVGAVLIEPVGNKVPVLLIGLSVVGLTVLEYLAYCFRALGQLRQEARAYLLARGLNLLLGAVVLLLGLSVWGLAVAANLAVAVAVLYSYGRLRGYVRPRWHLEARYWRHALSQRVALGLGIVLSMAAFRVDNLLIPPLVGAGQASAALSTYNAAYKLFEVSLIVPGVVLAATFPLLARATSPGGTGFGRLLWQLTGGLLALGLAASLALGLGAGPLIGALYGGKFDGSVAVLQVLALGCLPMYASYALTHALVALDRAQAYAGATLAALLTNVAANLLLIPAIGVAGAALATFLTEGVMVLICAGAVLYYAGPLGRKAAPVAGIERAA